MENASKALFIAGAILLVIAIIAIAVGIVSSTRGTIGTAENQIDSMAVQMHNKMFEKYEGKNKSYNEIKECIAEIVAYNSEQKNSDLYVQLQVREYKVGKFHKEIDNTIHLNCNYGPMLIGNYKDTAYCFQHCGLFNPTKLLDEKKLWDILFEYDQNGVINVVKCVREHH